tara:strand:- start:457 stop:1074 length:618 start_codon:yes stop_codon:yes gene_type:complete
MSGDLTVGTVTATEFITSQAGLQLGIGGGISLSGINQGLSSLTSDLDIYSSGTMDIKTTDGLNIDQLTTTSGLTIEHGPATISGAAIATEPYVDSELTSLSGVITSDLTTLSGVLQSQITNSDLDIAGDTGSDIDITDGEVLTIQGGTSGNIFTQVSGTAVNIEMSDDISLSGTLSVADLTTVEDGVVNSDLTVHGSLTLPYLAA